MEIKIIDYGLNKMPNKAHYNDAGNDVYATESVYIKPNETYSMPLNFGVKLPDGYVGFIMPRSSMAARGIVTQLAPIDSGYNGNIHAIITNNSKNTIFIDKGDKIAQLVIFPYIATTLVNKFTTSERNNNGFGSTGV